jgi:hypothetical protein
LFLQAGQYNLIKKTNTLLFNKDTLEI